MASRGRSGGHHGEHAVVLAADGVEATVVPGLGARLASLRIAGKERIVDGGAETLAWGCYPMAPWVGRLESARVPWQGRPVAVPADHGRHAIHGLVHSSPWAVTGSAPSAAGFAADLPASWPWAGRVEQQLAVSPSALSVTGVVEAREAMPAALGWHPWWAFDAADTVELTVPAARVLVTDGELIPTGETAEVAGRATDLRSGARLGSRRLDHTYVDLQGPIGFAWPDVSAVMEPGPGMVAVHVFVTDQAVCLEPLTAWPNAHALAPRGVPDTGLAVVTPGSPLRTGWRLRWRLTDTAARTGGPRS